MRTPRRAEAPGQGSTPIEALDLYPAKAANAPVNIFVHGGAWRVGLAKGNAFHAEMRYWSK